VSEHNRKRTMSDDVMIDSKDTKVEHKDTSQDPPRVEGFLRGNLEELRTIFALLPVGAAILDSKHRIIVSNPALENILGANEEELREGVYRQWKYLRADTTPMSWVEFPTTIAEKEQRIIKAVVVGLEKEDGGIVWTEVRAAPLNLSLADGKTGQIDLLITDLIMPEMNGRDLTDLLLFFYPTLKCLFMTCYTSNVISNQRVLAEGINFIQKPFSEKGLADKVRKILLS
jgi:PAS domain S-box-containing protein